jgi:hypothetical protein
MTIFGKDEMAVLRMSMAGPQILNFNNSRTLDGMPTTYIGKEKVKTL